MQNNIPSIIEIPGFSDPFSSMIHLMAALIFIVMSVFLVRRGRGSKARVFALSVFSFACVFQLSISGSYHILSPGDGRAVLQRIDHAAIFLLIAASFTTIHGILFKGVLRWGVLLLVWATSISGITLKTIFFNDIPEWLGLVFFLSLGWIGVFTAVMVCVRYGVRYNRFLFFSGLSYTIGATLEYLRAPVIIEGVIQAHELFHIAVIMGIGFHWKYTYSFADGIVRRQYQQLKLPI